MATIKHARGVKLLLKVGNGATPEVFNTFCSINAARGITFTSATNEFPAIDCDDPEKVAWLLREKASLSAAVTGAGTLNTPDVAAFFAWQVSPDSKNCQVVVDVPAADGGVVFEGAFHETDFEITGDLGAVQQCSITLASDGEVTLAANT
jgi:predicted secreted protein